MIDPVTAVGLATTAFNGIKQAIAMGKDIQDMSGQLGNWAKAISDVDYAHQKAEKPRWWKKLGGGVQANAMEVWMQKKKADEMREELRSFISAVYGPSAWKEIVHIEGVMRKEQKEAVYAAQEMKEQIIAWVLGILLTLTACAAMSGIIYLIKIFYLD
jgi:predicted small secreted protein